jgi:hypothetical protein
MLRRAYSTVTSSSSSSSSNTKSAALKLIQTVSEDPDILLQVLSTKVISAANNNAPVTIISTQLWQHLTALLLCEFEHVCSNQKALCNHLKQSGLQQINTVQPSVEYPQLKYATLFTAVAQILSSGGPSGSAVLSVAAHDTDAIKQLAPQIFAAFLSDLAGGVKTDYSSSTNTSSYIDAGYVKSVLDAYGSDSTAELISALWSGKADVHSILVSLLTRFLPVQIQVDINLRMPMCWIMYCVRAVKSLVIATCTTRYKEH